MDKIHEIRVEEVNDHEEGKHFYRVYMEINETIKIIGESEKINDTYYTGTEITFLPSTKTFKNIDFNFGTVEKRLRELAFLNTGVNIVLKELPITAPPLAVACWAAVTIPINWSKLKPASWATAPARDKASIKSSAPTANLTSTAANLLITLVVCLLYTSPSPRD